MTTETLLRAPAPPGSPSMPTITEAVKSLPLIARVAVIGVVVLAPVDHFGPGFVL